MRNGYEPAEEYFFCDKCGKIYGIAKEETIEQYGFCGCE